MSASSSTRYQTSSAATTSNATEMSVPITQDSRSFEERQRTIWDDMQARMERRRREWDEEVETMRKDFFRLKPAETRRGSSDNLLATMDLNDIFYDDVHSASRGGSLVGGGGGTKAGPGDKRFRVSFDVAQFGPEEIDVRTDGQRLIVHAKHEERAGVPGGKTLSREFSRQIDIPRHVDPLKLQCTLSTDGILQIEAPVPAPAYERIKGDSAAAATSSQGAMTSSPSRSSASHGDNLLLSSQRSSAPLSLGRFPASGLAAEEAHDDVAGIRRYKITVEVGTDFAPGDVTVKTVDRKLVVNARHEEKSFGRTSCKEFSREFDLPENVDPNLVTASMTDDGKLLVEAPISSIGVGAGGGTGSRQLGFATTSGGSSKQPQVTVSFGNRS